MSIRKKIYAMGVTIACAAVAAVGVTSVQAAGQATDIDPAYTPVSTNFTRVQTDANFRSQYHYAPVFQPVENQCANVMQGNWARVTCWTDDGDNLLVRVEFVHPRIKPVGVYIKDDTADTPTGGEVKRFDGRNKRFYEIPAQNRTADGNPYIIFNYEKFQSEAFWIEAVDNLNDRYADFTVNVNRNVNRATDADPVVARQAVTYEGHFYKLSEALHFEKIVEVDGKLKAVYSMVNAVESEAANVERIEVWPVSETNYTWRNDPGVWSPYVEVPTRSNTCDSRNVDVPRVNKMGVTPLVFTAGSADYPLIRDGAKTSIMVDVKPGYERIQYETWMSGCKAVISPRQGQMRPYQGQLVLPPYARMAVNKNLGPLAESSVASTQEFGGTIAYPAGTVTSTFADPSRWGGALPSDPAATYTWEGTRSWSYPANTINWAAVGGGTWQSPLLPAESTVTVTENQPAAPGGSATWNIQLPDPVKLGRVKITSLYNEATQSYDIGKEKTAVNTANTVPIEKTCGRASVTTGTTSAPGEKITEPGTSPTQPEYGYTVTRTTNSLSAVKHESSKIAESSNLARNSSGVTSVSVVNELDLPPCPEPTPTPTPEPTTPEPTPTPTTPEPTPTPSTPEPTPTPTTSVPTSPEPTTQVPTASPTPKPTPSAAKKTPPAKKLAWTGADTTTIGALALAITLAGGIALWVRRREN